MNRAFDRIGVAALALALVLVVQPLCGQESDEDVVRVRSGSGTIRLSGTLERWDEHEVVLKVLGKTFRYPAEDVVEVSATLSPTHRSAVESLDAGKYAEAIDRFGDSLQRERRPWARARIELGLVQALTGAGRLDQAGQGFLEIARRREDVSVMASAPLVWEADAAVSDAAVEQAKRWLESPPSPLGALLACSWLLSTPAASDALSTLERLETDPDPRVGLMARAQRWRYRVAREEPEAAEIERYRRLVETMPTAIRPGPQFVLGTACDKAGLDADAALAYLWLPLVHVDASGVAVGGGTAGRLAREAFERAIAATRRAGFAEDAQKLQDEFDDRFGAKDAS